jgi:asparagine synthase (glutamine-hydrolysing)
MIARRAMQGAMPESIRMGRRKVGFNSPMPEWLNGPLAGWTKELLERKVPAFAEIVDEAALRSTATALTDARSWSWDAVGRIFPYLNMKWALERFG